MPQRPGMLVKHDGQPRCMRDGAEMLEQSFLRRFVVIRRDLERTVRADILGPLRQINRLFRRVRAGAGNDFDFAAGKCHRTFDDANMFLAIHGRRFAGGADGYDAVHAAP